MQSKQATVLNTLVRVQRFLDVNGDKLDGINQSGYRKILDDVVENLSGHAVNQTSSKHAVSAEAAKGRALRNALRLNHMRPIASVAAAQLRNVPEFVSLRMPPANSRARTLIDWAASMAKAADPYAGTFVGAGLPADFLTQLKAAADAVSATIVNRDSTRAAQRGATAGLNAEASRGRSAVKVLDSLVEPLIAGDISLLSQWNAAKKFGGKAAAVTDTSVDAAAKGPETPLQTPAAPPAPPVAPPPSPAAAPAEAAPHGA